MRDDETTHRHHVRRVKWIIDDPVDRLRPWCRRPFVNELDTRPDRLAAPRQLLFQLGQFLVEQLYLPQVAVDQLPPLGIEFEPFEPCQPLAREQPRGRFDQSHRQRGVHAVAQRRALAGQRAAAARQFAQPPRRLVRRPDLGQEAAAHNCAST